MNTELNNITTLNKNNVTDAKDIIKKIYSEEESRFRPPYSSLSDAFLKLRKISGFAFLIMRAYHYSDKIAIEREYNINYNIDIDLKRVEYGFYATTIEALRAYYNPNRQQINKDIYTIFNTEDSTNRTRYINVEEFIKKYEDSKKRSPTTIAPIDLITLQNKLIYECNIQVSLVGGIVTKENSSGIKCYYENNSMGADSLKEYYKLPYSQFIDLRKQIEDVEKKKNIKYKKTEMESVLIGPDTESGITGATTSGAVTSSTTSGAVAGPTKSSGDFENFISKYDSNPSEIIDALKMTNYSSVNDFMKKASSYDTSDKSLKLTTELKSSKINATNQLSTLKQQNDLSLLTPDITNEETQKLEFSNMLIGRLTGIIESIDKNMILTTSGGRKTRKRLRKKRRHIKSRRRR